MDGKRENGMEQAAAELKSMRFWAGFGKASFQMKRGSFKIRDKVSRKIRLDLLETQEGFELADAGGAVRIAASVTQEGGAVKIVFKQTKGKAVSRFWIGMPAKPEERVFGCGECFSEFDLKGKKARIWVAEHQNISRIMGKIVKNALTKPNPLKKQRFEKYETYYAQPTFTSSEKYFVHVDSDAFMEFCFDESEHFLYMHALPQNLFIGRAGSFEELSASLTGILGRQPLVPGWINDGLIIAVQGDSDGIRSKVKTAQEAGIPLAGVWTQDWCGVRFTKFGRQVMWNWKWDPGLYKEPVKLLAELHGQGIRFLGYINPFIAIEGDVYRYATEHGYCIRDSEGKDYLATTTTFPAAMIDFTNPEAYEWYKALIKHNMIGFGLDGWMADFGEYMPVDAVLHQSADSAQTHNAWPAIWARLNREALEEAGRADEVFFFTRAGHTGTVRDSMMMWNGDQHVDWSVDDGLPSVIPATLSLAMSGYGIAHSDIGGYTTMPGCKRDEELLMRWAELAAFSPVMRCHEGNRPGDNAQFDASAKVLAHFSLMTRIHVALKEYINACILQNHRAGTPVMRPLFYHYDEDGLLDVSDAYLLGRDIACYPVVRKGALSREVTLPKDEWVHLLTGQEFGGGNAVVENPIGCPPVFYRKSSEYRNLFEQVRTLYDGITENQ